MIVYAIIMPSCRIVWAGFVSWPGRPYRNLWATLEPRQRPLKFQFLRSKLFKNVFYQYTHLQNCLSRFNLVAGPALQQVSIGSPAKGTTVKIPISSTKNLQIYKLSAPSFAELFEQVLLSSRAGPKENFKRRYSQGDERWNSNSFTEDSWSICSIGV